MRCPGCGSDTTAGLPRCARCNAPLDAPPGGDATHPDRPGEDETARDPLGGGTPGLGDPLPSAWAPSGPPLHWGASSQPPPDPPDHGSPYGQPPPAPPPGPVPGQPFSGQGGPTPPDETHTLLSPEPWAEPEPAIWQPPPPPERSKAPYFLAAAGGVLLLGLALAIVFWPSGSETPSQTAGNDVPSVQADGPGPEETGTGGEDPGGEDPGGEDPGGEDVEEQAKAIDGLLDEMGTTRSELGGVVAAGCSTGGVQRILNEREGQLSRARDLDVSALDNGSELKDALVRALEASAESNRRYLEVAPGCPSDSEVADVNQRASGAKSEFLRLWAPVAEETGLSPRSESDI